jgi:glycosyltransferase involved in cell wall biosynthesis
MKRILYVSAFIPSENAQHAGGRVAYENLSRLRGCADAVDALVCSTEAGVEEAARHAGVQRVDQRPWHLLGYLLREARTLGLQAVLAAPVLHTRLNLEAHRQLVELLKTHAYDEVFVDFTQAVLLVERAVAAAAPARPVKIIVCLHDVWAQRMLRTPGLVSAVFAGLVLRQEQRLVAGADAVLALSDKDSALLSSLYAVTHVSVKPFTAPAWTAKVRRSAASIDPRMLVFFGNFDRPDNSTAVTWFLGQALADIEREVPGVHLMLLGTGSDHLARRLGDRRVSGIGFVEDPSPYFSRCALAIAPLMRGAGVKFKVLEALAGGGPVVGTPVACEGIADQPLLTRAEPEEFAARTALKLAALQPPALQST